MNIPPKECEIWKKLLLGELGDLSLKNFFFQMKVTQARNQVEKGAVSLENAITELHALCTKFSTAKNMPEDIEAIFGTKCDKNNEVDLNIEISSDGIGYTDSKQEVKELMSILKVEKELAIFKESVILKDKEIQKKNTEIKKKNTEITAFLKENTRLQKENEILRDTIKKYEAEFVKMKSMQQTNQNKPEDEDGIFSKLFKK